MNFNAAPTKGSYLVVLTYCYKFLLLSLKPTICLPHFLPLEHPLLRCPLSWEDNSVLTLGAPCISHSKRLCLRKVIHLIG